MTRMMKDSGVEWIGEIPEGWEVANIGQYFKQRNEKVSDLDYPPLSVTKQGIVPQLESAAKSSNHNDRKLVKEGDFVINSRSDRKMSAGVAQEDGSVSLINLVLYYDIIEMNTNYVAYLLKNVSFAEEFYRWGTGIVADLWATKWDRMKKISIPYPTLVEQKKIAKILDDKVKNIDNIIAETQESISELKKYKQSLITEVVTKGFDDNVEMKDSGIECIGKIPKNWQIIPLKYLATINGRIGYRGYTTEDIVNAGEGAITYSPSNISNMVVQDNTGLTYISWEKYEESPEIKVKDNDIIFCKTGSGYGKSGIIDNLNLEATINPQLVIIRSKINNYLINYLNSNVAMYQIETIVGGSTMPTISQEKLLSLKIILPTESEMIRICSYLNVQIGNIDEIIRIKEKIISKYQNYKKSMIYEYVTGKREVQ